MASFLVSSIRRDGFDLDRRIDQLAGPSFGPSPIDDVISDIQLRRNQYYVTGSGLIPAYLEVQRHPRSGRLYLRTIPDGLYDNNLYTLPEIRR